MPRAETTAGILGLIRWSGRGIVRLLDSDSDQGGMLLERMGAPGPIAPVAALLAHAVSPDNRFMTGQVIYCDGGTDALVRGSRPQKVFLRYRPREVWALVQESRRLALLPPDMKTEPKLR